MKTAEEWHNQYRKDEGWVYPHIDDIRAIQADALRHAAGVAEKICNQRDRLVTGELIGDTLLAEADKLTKP